MELSAMCLTETGIVTARSSGQLVNARSSTVETAPPKVTDERLLQPSNAPDGTVVIPPPRLTDFIPVQSRNAKLPSSERLSGSITAVSDAHS